MKPKRLKPCPDTPNCVSSQADKVSQFTQPIRYQAPADLAFNRLERAILALPGSRIIVREEQYLHAEFHTRWLRFIDDVEAILDAKNNTIHIRSASRVGYADLGTNRKRIESIRNLYIEYSGGNEA